MSSTDIWLTQLSTPRAAPSSFQVSFPLSAWARSKSASSESSRCGAEHVECRLMSERLSKKQISDRMWLECRTTGNVISPFSPLPTLASLHSQWTDEPGRSVLHRRTQVAAISDEKLSKYIFLNLQFIFFDQFSWKFWRKWVFMWIRQQARGKVSYFQICVLVKEFLGFWEKIMRGYKPWMNPWCKSSVSSLKSPRRRGKCMHF